MQNLVSSNPKCHQLQHHSNFFLFITGFVDLPKIKNPYKH